jgi:hypothetical protein
MILCAGTVKRLTATHTKADTTRASLAAAAAAATATSGRRNILAHPAITIPRPCLTASAVKKSRPGWGWGGLSLVVGTAARLRRFRAGSCDMFHRAARRNMAAARL